MSLLNEDAWIALAKVTAAMGLSLRSVTESEKNRMNVLEVLVARSVSCLMMLRSDVVKFMLISGPSTMETLPPVSLCSVDPTAWEDEMKKFSGITELASTDSEKLSRSVPVFRSSDTEERVGGDISTV